MCKIYVHALREVSITLIKGEELLKIWGHDLLPGENLGDYPLAFPAPVRLRDTRQALTFPLPDTLEMNWVEFKALWDRKVLDALTKPLGLVIEAGEPNWLVTLELAIKIWSLWFDKLEVVSAYMLSEFSVPQNWNEDERRVALELSNSELRTAKERLQAFHAEVIAKVSVESN